MNQIWEHNTKGATGIPSELQITNNPDKAVADMARIRGGLFAVQTFADLSDLPVDILKDRVTIAYVNDEDTHYHYRSGNWVMLISTATTVWNKTLKVTNVKDGDFIEHGLDGFCVIRGFVDNQSPTMVLDSMGCDGHTNAGFVLRTYMPQAQIETTFSGYLIIQRLYKIP